MNNTIVLSQLSKSIAELTQCTEADAETFVRELFVLAAEKLQADDMVTIPGIGTFRVNDEDIAFAPDAELAETLNAPFSAFEAVELPEDYEEENNTDDSTERRIPAYEPEPAPEPEQVPEPEAEAWTPPSHDDPEEIVEEEVTSAIDSEAVSLRYTRPRSYCWVCWVVACLLCFAAGWTARGLMEQRLPAYESEPVIAAEAEAESLPATPEPEPEPISEAESLSPTIVYDTIGANRYLTTMARAHYGQMEYWVYIYQENADKLGHPDRLDAGVTVVIPPAEKYGLKAGDEAKIKEASELAKQIYSRFN